MKGRYLLPLMMMMISLFCLITGYTQGSNDGSPVKAAQGLRLKFHLSDSALSIMRVVAKNRVARMDSLNAQKSLTIDQRNKKLSEIQQQYREQIRTFLTSEQWQQFLQMEAAARDSLIQWRKSKQAAVKELN